MCLCAADISKKMQLILFTVVLGNAATVAAAAANSNHQQLPTPARSQKDHSTPTKIELLISFYQPPSLKASAMSAQMMPILKHCRKSSLSGGLGAAP